MVYIEVVAGFALLLVGGDALVRGAVSVARRLGVSPLLIGLTLVGFGTSTPELVTSLEAAFAGSPGIAVGNVVGSNIANILLILGAAAVISPLTCDPKAFYRDGTMLVGASLAALAVAAGGTLGHAAGAGFLVALAGYVVFTYVKERRSSDASAAMHAHEADLAEPRPTRLWLALVLVGGGMAMIIFGARLLVAGAIAVAGALGVSETVIGLTVVAVGTSLPELVTSVVAALRRQGDLALGNVVGSNIFNVLGILGVTALVHPLRVPAEILGFDIWVMLGATALLIGFAITDWRLSRREGLVFVLGYLAYVAVLVARTSG